MTNEEIINLVRSHPSGKVKLAVTDIDGILRGKYISVEKFLSVVESNLGFCDVIFGWDSGDVAYDNGKFTGWHSGYPDANAKLDLTTYRQIPWEQDVPFFLAEFVEKDSTPAFYCPRQLLKKIKSEAEKEGFRATFSQEFEWFNFKETPDTLHEKDFRKLKPLTPGMFGYSILRTSLQNPFFTDLFELISKFKVPIEGLHTETGPGTYEAAITHSDILEAADRAVLFKTSVKEIAYQIGRASCRERVCYAV